MTSSRFFVGPGGLLGTNNLLAVPEPRHSYLRRLIMPAFSSEAVTLLLPRMETVLDKYLNRCVMSWCK
jgi:cytochrome P450